MDIRHAAISLKLGSLLLGHIMDHSRINYAPIIIGAIIGAGVGFCLLFFAFITAFGICSDTFFAEILFPYALNFDPTLHDRGLLALLLALIQCPTYGIVIGYVWVRRRAVVWQCVMILFVAHVIAIFGAQYRVKAMWEYRFSHMSSH
jgi:hypothetical protein